MPATEPLRLLIILTTLNILIELCGMETETVAETVICDLRSTELLTNPASPRAFIAKNLLTAPRARKSERQAQLSQCKPAGKTGQPRQACESICLPNYLSIDYMWPVIYQSSRLDQSLVSRSSSQLALYVLGTFHNRFPLVLCVPWNALAIAIRLAAHYVNCVRLVFPASS